MAEQLCEHCKKEVATKVYEIYSDMEEDNIFKLSLCDECFINACVSDWEDSV